MENFYFTFGCGSKLADNFVKIPAEDYDAARVEMFKHYGPKWAFQYDEKEFAGQEQRWGITEVPLGTPSV